MDLADTAAAADPTTDPALERFLAHLAGSLADGSFAKLVLAKPARTGDDLLRVTARQVLLRGEPALSLVYTHKTRDITKNHAFDEGLAVLRELLGPVLRNAHLHTRDEDWQLNISKKGRGLLHVAAATQGGDAATTHDREKQRWLELTRPFLTELGVTTAQHQLIPAMARKWKQINKFVEVFAHALASSRLAEAKEVHVIDFGSGKGYLTFAIHDWLTHSKGVQAQVTGVELRPDMVALCNKAIAKLDLQGLRIEEGDVRSYQPGKLDVMIALHACDTATDHAIHLGLRAGAEIIMCSPCCHKELRPQLLSPHPLKPILQHGVHLGQQAEMLTDGLRAMLLDACGYDTQVFEFVSLEHTNKNKMILAVKRLQPRPNDEVLQQVREIKDFYRIQAQCLETLLREDGLLPA
ncbi:MAG TPA: SAM-dependent methyltransferase [Rhizobacter sp.]|nr:SAM-dependent methyltransferase [Rhizobacter sp.]